MIRTASQPELELLTGAGGDKSTWQTPCFDVFVIGRTSTVGEDIVYFDELSMQED